jgi:ATP-dependent Clp protease protease subunit
VLLQLVPAVTELVISELLWLNYSAPEKPVYVYLNSIGSQGPDGQAVGFETEAYAILDTLAYIRPEIHTLVVGQAYGNAAMILASGKKGSRFSLPNARIMTAPPRMNRSFGSVSNMMIKANELEYNTQSYVDFLAQYTGTDSFCGVCTLSCAAVDFLGCEGFETLISLLCDGSPTHLHSCQF